MIKFKNYKKVFIDSLNLIDESKIELLVKHMQKIKKKSGRLFILGIGGSAGNASHAVNDFRKLCEIEAYTPVDNISEITATTNDEGFDNIFYNFLKRSQLRSKDAILILSVGGGNKKKNVSINLIKAIKYAKKIKSKIFSIVGKKDGYSFKNSDVSIYAGTDKKNFITPIAESLQTCLWHYLVTDKRLQKNKTKW